MVPHLMVIYMRERCRKIGAIADAVLFTLQPLWLYFGKLVTNHLPRSALSSHPESHRDIPERSQVVILGTNGQGSEPQVTALLFHFGDDTLRMSINTTRQKEKNLDRDPRASAFFIDPENPYRTIELRGSVTIELDPDYAFAEKVGQKYGSDLREMDGPGEERSAVTFAIDKINTFG